MKRYQHRVLFLFYVLFFCLAISEPAKAATSYVLTSFDYPDASQTLPGGIDTSGKIVGAYVLGAVHGFVLNGGSFTTIDFPGAAETRVNSISPNGQFIVGNFSNAAGGLDFGSEYPFVLNAGVFTALPDAPGSYPGSTRAWGVNSSGQIVGDYLDPCFCNLHGFLFSGGTYTTVSQPGFSTTSLTGNNDSGQIVGNSTNSFGAGQQGFLLSGGVFSPINEPASVPNGTNVTGINNIGQIVGYFSTVGGNPQGFLLSGGAFTVIPTPTGADGLFADGINTAGQIVGYFGGGGANHGLLFAPAAIYKICLLYDATKAGKSGSTIPIKLQLCDGNGNDASSPSLTLHAVSSTQTSSSISGAVQDSGNANPDNDFRFDTTLGPTGGYIFNLSTKGIATGTYSLNFTVTGDSFVYGAQFQVK